jgi:hypothetical protein
MTLNFSSGACAAIALLAMTTGTVAQSPLDGLKNEMVELKYDEPTTAAFTPIRERLQHRGVLEKLQIFLSPLKLPRKLTVRTAECGRLYVPVAADGTVTLCYEYVAKIEKDAPSSGAAVLGQIWLTREEALVGPVAQGVLHDVARSLFTIYKMPVWGNSETAADHVAAYTMLHFGKQVAWKTVIGTGWFLWDSWDNPVDITDIRPHLAQRYYNLLCVAFGADPVTFGVFVPINRAATPLDLPQRRAARCRGDYAKLDFAFKNLIYEPHVDKQKYEQLRKLELLREF